MSDINKIAAQTIVNLSKKNISPTPNEYHKEFCTISKSYDLNISECKQFKELVAKLSESEQIEIKEKNIQTIEEMIPILLNRVATKNLDKLTNILTTSLTPSINIELDESLAKFSIKIGNSPALMFEEDIQKEIQNFITKRFEADQKIVKQKTEDIAKLVTLMGQYLNDAIKSNGNGSKNVTEIKTSIESINMDDSQSELLALQNKLISAAKSIENEMNEVNKKLHNGKDQVCSLEEKIKNLETELDSARKESTTDHLTGLMTRRAYDEAITRVENLYQRTGQAYAIVFFDIDHFKNVNDTYGHEGGDVILKTFAKVLQKETRGEDIVCRYGGEEFVAIINYNLKRELLKYIKRVKAIITQNKFVYKDNKIKVTFSAGIAQRDKYSSYENTIQKADILLYEAKDNGRDKVILDDGTII